MGIWVFDDVFKASGTRPGEQWDGRTNAPRRVFTGKRSPKIKCIVRDVEISISEDEIFSYFRHETLKSLLLLYYVTPTFSFFPCLPFVWCTMGFLLGVGPGMFFFSLPAPKSEKTCGCSSTREWLFFFFFAGARSRLRVIVTLTRAAQGHTHTHTPDRSIDRVDDTHSDERERERKKE